MDGIRSVNLLRGSVHCPRCLTSIPVRCVLAALLTTSSGCAFSRSAIQNSLMGATPAPAAATEEISAAKPDCAVPGQTVSPQMTAYPVLQVPASQMLTAGPAFNGQPGYGMPPASAYPPGQQFANNYPAGIGPPHYESTPAVPPIPRGYKLVPEYVDEPQAASSNLHAVPTVPGSGPPGTSPVAVSPPVNPAVGAAVETAENEKAACERQVADLNEKVWALQTAADSTQQQLRELAAMNGQISRDNQRLRKRLDVSNKQQMDTLDSLSKLLDDDLQSSVPAPAPAPGRKPRLQTPPVMPDQAIYLPGVDE